MSKPIRKAFCTKCRKYLGQILRANLNKDFNSICSSCIEELTSYNKKQFSSKPRLDLSNRHPNKIESFLSKIMVFE
jgi:hypothetical protein